MADYGAIKVDNEQEPLGGDTTFEDSAVFDKLFLLFGFHSNPLATSSRFSKNRNESATDMRRAMLSAFSTDYNVVSISLALHIIEFVEPGVSTANTSICSSALLAGMVAGQLFGGALGDTLGRQAALAVVMWMQVVASFLSAFSVGFSIGGLQVSMFMMLAFWRFILGVGCGGVYPLAATISAESRRTIIDRPKSVALTFSMQGVGFLTVPITAYILLSILGSHSKISWRLLLGLGCVPGLVLAVISSMADADDAREESPDTEMTEIAPQVSLAEALRKEPKLVRKLLGTAGTWFVFDVCFYGNTLFQPLVLTQAFGTKETLIMSARDTAVVAAIALPGYFVSVFMLGKQTPRYIQLQGFICMAILYTIIGADFHGLASFKWLLLILYASTFFFANYGSNSTTFMLPAMTYSKECRTTLNGVAAASGKIGALVGTSMFVPFSAHFGDNAAMLTCAFLCLSGFALTWFNVRQHLEFNLDEDSDESAKA